MGKQIKRLRTVEDIQLSIYTLEIPVWNLNRRTSFRLDYYHSPFIIKVNLDYQITRL